jgi:hypothetical protein
MDQNFACSISWSRIGTTTASECEHRLERTDRGPILSLSVPWHHPRYGFGVNNKEEGVQQIGGVKLDRAIRKTAFAYLRVFSEDDQL